MSLSLIIKMGFEEEGAYLCLSWQGWGFEEEGAYLCLSWQGWGFEEEGAYLCLSWQGCQLPKKRLAV